MSANRHPEWLKEARRAEGGGVSNDDAQRSEHLQNMTKDQDVRNGVLDQAKKDSDTHMPGNYEDVINRANESGADPGEVQDILQDAIHKGD